MDGRLFVGLGNPGPEYEMTRHNLGFLVVKALASRLGWHFREEKRFMAFVAKGTVGGVTLHLLLPTTYMNLSGTAVRAYMDFHKLSVDQVTVVVDDSALPFGQLRLKQQGSSGGHNGLKSIEVHLGTADYMRLRMGIGTPQEKMLIDHVLDPFGREELQQLVNFIDRGVEVLALLVKESPSFVMSMANRVEKRSPESGLRSEEKNA